MSHPRPWRKVYASTFSGNGTFPLYLVAADGRKICSVWGKEDGERQETADLIIKAVRTYDRAMKVKAEREAANTAANTAAMAEMPGLKEALDVD